MKDDQTSIRVYIEDDIKAWAKKKKRGEIAKMVKEFLREQMLADPDGRKQEAESIQMQLGDIQGNLKGIEQEKQKEREKAIAEAKHRLAKAELLLEDAMKCADAKDEEGAISDAIRAFKMGITLKRLKEALPPFIFKQVKEQARKVRD